MNQYNVEINFEDLFFSASNQNCPISESQWQSWLTQWLNYLELDLDVDKFYEINLRLTDDQEIQSLNQQFRNQNKPTDVLSFATLENDFPELEMIDSIPLGDIIISTETAMIQSQSEGHSLTTELAWLASHGLLHLLGWDHPDDDSLKKMLTIQQKLLKLVNVEVPLWGKTYKKN